MQTLKNKLIAILAALALLAPAAASAPLPAQAQTAFTSICLGNAESGCTLIPKYSYVSWHGNENCGGTTAGSYVLWVAPNTSETWQIAGATVDFSTAGGASAAVDVKVDTATNAPGAGATQLTGTMALTGTANTPVNGTISATPATIAAGNRVSTTTSGTLTGLAGCNATIVLQKLS